MSTTHIRYFEDEGDEGTVRRCAHCKGEIFWTEPHVSISNPDVPGETLLLHNGIRLLDCLTKWYDARRSRVQVDSSANLQART